jgi:hypothetical protein
MNSHQSTFKPFMNDDFIPDEKDGGSETSAVLNP